MKILIDLTSLADNFSGIERYAACLSRELINIGGNEFILLFKEEIHPMFKEYKDDEQVEMVVIPRCKKIVFNQIRLPLEIIKHKADWYIFLAFPVPVLLFRKNMVSTIHDICCWDCPETMNGLSNWYFKISHVVAMKKCKAIITISEFSKRRILDRLNYQDEKLWLIYCGVDNKFLNYQKSKNRSEEISKKYNLPNRYLLSLSTLEPRKNLRFLIETYSKLVLDYRYNIPLVLAGRKGWKIDQLLSGIDSRVRELIRFTGFIDDEDLPPVYGGALFFIFPSMYEGFGMPPLEALACETSVLVSNSTSLPEVLGNNATFFDCSDIEDLCKKILNAKKGDYLTNYKDQVNKFSWNQEASKLLELMRKSI